MIRGAVLTVLLLAAARTAAAQQCYVVDWKKGTHCTTDGSHGCPVDDVTYKFRTDTQCFAFVADAHGRKLDIDKTACVLVNKKCEDVTTAGASVIQNLVEMAIVSNPKLIAPIAGFGLLNDLLTPSKEDQEKKRLEEQARAAEAERQAELARKAEEERVRREEERKNSLLTNMKGVSPQRPELQAKLPPPVVLGLKLGEKGPFGTTQAKDPIDLSRPPKEWRDVDTPWKQLWCGAELATKAAGASKLEDIGYFANESGRAMDGEAFGARCSTAPALAVPSKDAAERRKKEIKELVTKLAVAVNDAKTAAAPDVPAKRVEPKPQPPAPARQGASPPQPPAPPKPQPPPAQTADEKRIQEVYRQQKENEATQGGKVVEVVKQQQALQTKLNEPIKEPAEEK
jgi:hypothetical protein